MKKTLVLVLLLFLTMPLLMAVSDSNYKRYETIEIDSTKVTGAEINPYNNNGVALPIEAFYDPGVDEGFYIRSSNNDKIEAYYDDMPVSYNTDNYDITSVGESEYFTLYYINNLRRKQKRWVDIFYDKQFYSVDGSKYTGIDIDFQYSNLLTNSNISLKNHYSGDSAYITNGNNNETLGQDAFKFLIKKGYHNTSLIKFKFTWNPTDLDSINAYARSINGKTFSNGERVVSFVLIQIEAD